MKPLKDDGRTIVNMNVEGMPGYRPEQPIVPKLTKPERRALILNATLAALAVGAIFAAGLIAFVAFCVWVWLK